MGRHGSCRSEISIRFFDSSKVMAIFAEISTNRASIPGSTVLHLYQRGATEKEVES